MSPSGGSSSSSQSYGAINIHNSANGMDWAEVEPRSNVGDSNNGDDPSSDDDCKGWKAGVFTLLVVGLVGFYFWGPNSNRQYFSDITNNNSNINTTTTTTNPVGLVYNDINDNNTPSTTSSSNSNELISFPMPNGVNVGSWLSLEDYFFAGGSAVEVATPDGSTAAVCLPPLHTGQFPAWNSETDLLSSLRDHSSLAYALRVFHAHRTSFFDFEEDLKTLVQLGIKSLRVPISWCLTDYDPAELDQAHLVDDEELENRFTCEDPFYKGVFWPAVPRSLLVNLLNACGKHGVGVTLDLHTYPGATSPGTFSGLWPRWPRFWTHGDQPATDKGKYDIGRTLWKDFVDWIESLNDDTLSGLKGLSPMNEPAHLAGVFVNGKGSNPPFLPPLPEDMAKAYTSKLAASNPEGSLTAVPDGPHLRVFKWLDDAVDVFRQSSLPARGIQVSVNVHESVLSRNAVIPLIDRKTILDDEDASMHIVAAWWRGATTLSERQEWAVLDVHHYHAWDKNCQGASDGHWSGNYTCSNVEERRSALERCTSWATNFRKAVDTECGEGALLMSGEMSASTHHSVLHACNDLSTLRDSYLFQLHAAQEGSLDLYWWSYKMPYGGAFRPAWSLKHFLWLMGILPRPDESNYLCGDHVPIENEPKDTNVRKI